MCIRDSTGSVPAENIAGGWQILLDDGCIIDLTLYQSSPAIFGRGSVSLGISSRQATASGSLSGSALRLDVVPEDGGQLYALSLDIGRLPVTGSYLLFSPDSSPRPGTLRASRAGQSSFG
ncbi:MAG: hypothetical protein QUS08_08315, partial [Methanothrix sp.]|nr:hypothetical protein [Methanothrix sp.]